MFEKAITQDIVPTTIPRKGEANANSARRTDAKTYFQPNRCASQLPSSRSVGVTRNVDVTSSTLPANANPNAYQMSIALVVAMPHP